MSDHRRFPNLPAGEGDPGQSAPSEIEQLRAERDAWEQEAAIQEHMAKSATDDTIREADRAKELESRLRVAVEALREIQLAWHYWVDSRPDGWEDEPDDPDTDAVDDAILHNAAVNELVASLSDRDEP